MREEDPDFHIIRHENRYRAIDVAFWLEYPDTVDIEKQIKKFIPKRKYKKYERQQAAFVNMLKRSQLK